MHGAAPVSSPRNADGTRGRAPRMGSAPRPAGVAFSLLGLCVTLAACGASTTAGNGLAGKSPAQILARARAAARGAATVRVTGSILDRGTPISLDMELVADKGGEGRVTFGSSTLELRGLDGYLYVKGDEAFVDRLAGPASGRLLRGSWLVGRANSPALRSLAGLTSLDGLVGGLLDDASTDALEHAGSLELDGREAIGVRDAGEGGTMYVAATGTPYPLEIVWKGAKSGNIAFESWNDAAEPEAPMHAISIKQLQSRG
jgi:hypothetical protein